MAGMMKTIRGGKGLGDSIYVLGVCQHLIDSGQKLHVLSDHAQIFSDLPVKVSSFQRNQTDIIAHYVDGKRNKSTTMWQDVCNSANIKADFNARWSLKNHDLVHSIRQSAAGRPVVLVVGGRAPMDREDGFGKELLPSRSGFVKAMTSLDGCFFVQIGNAQQIYDLPCDLNLNGKTSLSDLMDLGISCDAVVGQCSFAVPLAEIFNKPFMLVWSSAVPSAKEWFVRVMNPQKVMSGQKDRFVMDDWSDSEIQKVADQIRELM